MRCPLTQLVNDSVTMSIWRRAVSLSLRRQDLSAPKGALVISRRCIRLPVKDSSNAASNTVSPVGLLVLVQGIAKSANAVDRAGASPKSNARSLTLLDLNRAENAWALHVIVSVATTRARNLSTRMPGNANRGVRTETTLGGRLETSTSLAWQIDRFVMATTPTGTAWVLPGRYQGMDSLASAAGLAASATGAASSANTEDSKARGSGVASA